MILRTFGPTREVSSGISILVSRILRIFAVLRSRTGRISTS